MTRSRTKAPSRVPMLGDNPRPKLLPGERQQVSVTKTLNADDAQKWKERAASARCKVTGVE